MQVLKTRGIEYETIDISAPGMQVQHFDNFNIYGPFCHVVALCRTCHLIFRNLNYKHSRSNKNQHINHS